MASKDDTAPKTTLPSTSPFTLLPATLSDAEAIQNCSNKAFSSNYLTSQIFPKEKAHLVTASELFSFRVNRLKKGLTDDNSLYFKVVAKYKPEEVIAYAGWSRPGHFSKGVTDWKRYGAGSMPEGEVPEWMNWEVQRKFLMKRDEQREEIWGSNADYWYLGVMATDPDYRHQGLATALMREGILRADADGLPMYLEASPEGAKFYPKFGFEKVAEYGFFGGKHYIEFYVRPARILS